MYFSETIYLKKIWLFYNQISVNDGFEVEKSKFIWVHNVVENEVASRGCICQVEKICK